MLDRRAASWTGAALALALVGGCDEPPSYQLRWRLGDAAALADPALAPALTSVKQCADVGVSKVRVTTRRASDDTIVDSREYPCFPGAFERGDAVAIPALPAGEYVVTVERVRRTGEPWVCEEGEQCETFVDDTNTVTIGEGLLETIEVVLLQPAQCDDGVDNDRDGRVDGMDPACILDPSGPESAESSFTLFQTSVTFLDSPAVLPANVSVAALRFGIDTEADGDPSDDQLLAEVLVDDVDVSQWPFRLPLLSHDFDDGDYVLSVHAVDEDGNQLTSPHELEFSVPDDPFVVSVFEFGSDRFLAPIVDSFATSTVLQLEPTDLTGPPCELGGFAGVAVEQMWFRVTDQDEQPLDAVSLGLTGLASGSPIMAVDEANGWVSFACPTTAVSSTLLPWGSYEVEVEARIGAAACFTIEPLALAPVGKAGAQTLLLSRILDDQGVPPAGCEECFTQNDCSGQICDAGICKDISP